MFCKCRPTLLTRFKMKDARIPIFFKRSKFINTFKYFLLFFGLNGILILILTALDMEVELRFAKRDEIFDKEFAITETTTQKEELTTEPPITIKSYRSFELKNHIVYNFYKSGRVNNNQGSTGGGAASKMPHALEKAYFIKLQDMCTLKLSTELNLNKTDIDCTDIRYRYLPTMFIESEVLCMISSMKRMEKITLIERLNPLEFVSHSTFSLDSNDLIADESHRAHMNIIMPLTGRIDNLKFFLKNIYSILQNKHAQEIDLKIGVTLVYFQDENAIRAKAALRKIARASKRFVTHFILLKTKKFSRAEGLHYGIENTKINSDIVFLCDVDMVIKRDFVYRCLSTPILGEQIYFPVIFSLYNRNHLKGRDRYNYYSTSDEHGYWRVYGYGMVCAYRQDLLDLNAFHEKYDGWGKEDTAFAELVSKNEQYKIIRSLDPGIFHKYHSKMCDSSTTSHISACDSTRLDNEASKRTLARMYFKFLQNLSKTSSNKTSPK